MSSTTIESTTTGPATTNAPTTTPIGTTTTDPASATTVAVTTTVAETTSPPPTPETTAAPQTTATSETTPPPTAPPATVAPTTAAPTTSSPSGCTACRPDYRFAWPSYFDVPQLGAEPVRGTGCGADGSLGTTIPDGVWNGFITLPGSGSATSLQFDVQCIYYGESAAPYVAQCELTDTAEACLEYGDQFWMVNNNERTRTVELDPGFRRRYAAVDCTDPGPGKGATPQSDGQEDFDSWLIIENGRATFALTSCVYG